MNEKKFLAMFDLDGTLFDTRKVNFFSYKRALGTFGVNLDYDFFVNFCNGRHYKVFLSQFIDEDKIEDVHRLKKQFYSEYMTETKVNKHLINIIRSIKDTYYCAVVTTASRKNTEDILTHFNIKELFDIIITGDDVKNKKPDPECFFQAMDYFNKKADESIIFEDSSTGLEAALKTGAAVYKVFGFA